LKNYLYKWRNKAIKKNKKEEALEKMMKILEIKTLKDSVDHLADVSLLIKLLKNILKIRALYFLRKLKENGKRNNLYNNLSQNLINTNDKLLNEKAKPLINKIFKIYAYKVISTLFDNIENNKKKYLKLFIKEFLYKLYQINIKQRQRKYRKLKSYNKNPIIRRGMRLHINRIKPNIKRDEKNNKTIVYKQLTPFLVKYLIKIFRNKKEGIFNNLKYNVGLGDKFCKLLKIFTKKAQIPDKEDLVDSLKYYIYMKLVKESTSNKLYSLIRKAIIRKILNISKTTGSLIRLLQLVETTMIHKNIARDRWLLKLIKKWRFLTFVRKMAMKKMELMYKDLHVTYLEMADSVLNHGPPLGPNGANFLHDINKDKYSFDFYDPYLVKGAKPYKAIKKQIVFEPLDVEIEKRIKTIEEIKTIDKIKETNRTYYDYDDKNKGTIKKKYTEVKTKKIEIPAKKTGKIKIKKTGKEGKILSKKEHKIPNRGDFKASSKSKDGEYNKSSNLTSSFRSEIKSSGNDDLRESIKSEIRYLDKDNLGKYERKNSMNSEVTSSVKSDYGNGYEYEDKKYGNGGYNYINENKKKGNISYGNANYTSKTYSKGPGLKKNENKYYKEK
jgi:hypothetical protein